MFTDCLDGTIFLTLTDMHLQNCYRRILISKEKKMHLVQGLDKKKKRTPNVTYMKNVICLLLY